MTADALSLVFPAWFSERVRVAASGCWLWTGPRDIGGYGKCRNRDGFSPYAHRAAWQFSRPNCPLPRSVLHSCDAPACVNPSHLRAGDARTNWVDCQARGRFHRGWAMRKLTTGEVAAIFAAVDAGANRAELSKRYGMAPRTLANMLRARRLVSESQTAVSP